jgi:hypothetical protein
MTPTFQNTEISQKRQQGKVNLVYAVRAHRGAEV